MRELNPGEDIERLLRSWWIIVISMLIFGAAGYLFHALRPPVYEATTSFEVWLDFNYLTTTREFTEYDEDLSINAVGNSYVDAVVLQKVTDQALNQGWIRNANELIVNYRLERKHDNWVLRYESGDPQIAMDVVNYWATTAYQVLLEREKSGYVPAYVRFSEPTQAVLPTEPVHYGRNNLVLGGAMLGLAIGMLASVWLPGKKK